MPSNLFILNNIKKYVKTPKSNEFFKITFSYDTYRVPLQTPPLLPKNENNNAEFLSALLLQKYNIRAAHPPAGDPLTSAYLHSARRALLREATARSVTTKTCALSIHCVPKK